MRLGLYTTCVQLQAICIMQSIHLSQNYGLNFPKIPPQVTELEPDDDDP